jgi:hypothetical protein
MVVTAGMVWILMILIYLADCVVLVDRGQAIFEFAGRRWLANFGTSSYVLLGKPVVVLNPAAPWRVAIRSLPLFSGRSGRQRDLLMSLDVVRVIKRTELHAAVQAVLVLGLVPYLMYRAPGWPFLVALTVTYVNATIIISVLWFNRGRMRIPGSSLLVHSIYCLVCIPLSVNAARKTGLLIVMPFEALRLMRLLRGDDRSDGLTQLANQVAQARLETEDGSDRSSKLDALSTKLAGQRGIDDRV